MKNVFRLTHRTDGYNYYVLHTRYPIPSGNDPQKHHHGKSHGECKVRIVAQSSTPTSGNDHAVTLVPNPPMGVIAIVKHSRKKGGNALLTEEGGSCEITQETDTTPGGTTTVPVTFCSCGDETSFDCGANQVPDCNPVLHCVNLSPVLPRGALGEPKRPPGKKKG